MGDRLYVRDDTPVHSALHEAFHFACMDERQRVVILLTMLGREMEVPVRRDAIAAYA